MFRQPDLTENYLILNPQIFLVRHSGREAGLICKEQICIYLKGEVHGCTS